MRVFDWPMDVSRETSDRLGIYAQLLRKWNPRINLVSRNTLDDLETRHIADSMQVFDLASRGWKHWADLGSGGGFPGLVIAILAAEFSPEAQVTLVESDQRKCAFLRTVIRETGVPAAVIAERIEATAPLSADILSARALADLDALLGFADRHLGDAGTALFSKGANWKKEVDNARVQWRFDCEATTSRTEPNAVILKIGGITRV